MARSKMRAFLRRNRLRIFKLLIAIGVLGLILFGAMVIVWAQFLREWTGNQQDIPFSVAFQTAADQIRLAERHAAEDPAFRTKLLANRCRPPLFVQEACVIDGDRDEETLMAQVYTGKPFLRPRGWYLYKRLGTPSPPVEEPPPNLATHVRIDLAGGWWLEYYND